MRYMFAYSQFNSDLSIWDVGNVWNMYGMFEKSSFNQDIDMWNYNFKAIEENKHLVSMDSKLLKEFKEYLWKRG